MSIKEQLSNLLASVEEFSTVLSENIEKIEKGNRSKGKDLRKLSAELAKELKEFRSFTVENEKAVSSERKASKQA